MTWATVCIILIGTIRVMESENIIHSSQMCVTKSLLRYIFEKMFPFGVVHSVEGQLY